MDEYFLILTAIDVVVLLFMCMLIYESENLSRQRRGFLRTYWQLRHRPFIIRTEAGF